MRRLNWGCLLILGGLFCFWVAVGIWVGRWLR